VVRNLQRDIGSKEDPHFHRDVTMRLRSAMRGMHEGTKLQVVDLLKTGKLNVSTFFHGVHLRVQISAGRRDQNVD
jgi:hypothetical protein